MLRGCCLGGTRHFIIQDGTQLGADGGERIAADLQNGQVTSAGERKPAHRLPMMTLSSSTVCQCFPSLAWLLTFALAAVMAESRELFPALGMPCSNDGMTAAMLSWRVR